MKAKEFEKVVGRTPKDDDLERANCDQAGQPGHWSCGICKHGCPVFECQPCFVEAHRN